jgi:NAD(P)-dependent dehydrogenase (short-subunit alcohol dehydrogenase family)
LTPVPLAGKAIVVTGAGRGIGAAYARAAAVAGAAVVVNDVDAECAERVTAEVRAAGGDAVASGADITEWASAESLIGSCEEAFGAIDGLVNNAGLFRMARVDEQQEDDLRRLVEVNVLGTAFCGVHAARRMLARGRGSIVNVTSGAQAGIAAMGAYGATKGAVASLTYGWAVDLAGTGVRVNAVSPMARSRMVDTTARYLQSKQLPMYPGELPPPEANAPVVVYLLSDAAAGVHGQIVRIEGRQLSLMAHPAVLVPVLEADEWTVDRVADAFDRDLGQRQCPVGLTGVTAQPQPISSTFWEPASDAT